jgi:uncharacterized protein YhaN
MKIVSIELENFGTFYGKHVLELANKGLTLVLGDNQDEPLMNSNGAGKSSTFEGLDWTLFGDIPPSPHGSVFGTDAVCMPPVSAEPYRGIGRTGDCDCADDFTCAEHGGSHVLRDHK